VFSAEDLKLSEVDAMHRPGSAVVDESVDARRVALMRCMLALSAVLIVFLHPVQPERLIGLTYGSLIAYSLYSVLLAGSVYRARPIVPQRAQHWVDVVFSTYLLALTSGTDSVFFFFFFFAILVASFSRGFGEGLAVTLASVLLFVAVGLPASAGTTGFQLDRALLHAVFLFLLGWLIAYWGGQEIALRRRLRLLKEVGAVANPRLGVDHAVTQNLRRLLAFFAADACVLVCAKRGSADFVMYRADRSGQDGGYAPKPLTEQAAGRLLDLPPQLCVAWNPRRPSRDCPAEQCRRLANLLETTCFATCPYRQHEEPPGRVYLVAGKRCYGEADVGLLRQAVEQMAAAVENLALLEELMVNATQLERSRISRDIHDTAVQPYIGLKLGLEALHRKLEPDSLAALQVEELLQMSALAVHDLRGYVARLRSDDKAWAGEHLVQALRRQLGRYRAFYGIEVELRGDAAVELTERIAGEAYQIVSEALANVYRHTRAKRAFVELRWQADALAILVGNECGPGSATPAFTPHSIAERAAALGGSATVQVGRDGHDLVAVTIPL
jgi:signal transduction histidine kinase